MAAVVMEPAEPVDSPVHDDFSRRLRHGYLVILLLLLSLLGLPLLAHQTFRATFQQSIEFHEGWNTVHTARLMQGEPLYPRTDGFPVTPVNYPPLSFLITALFSFLTGSILHAGRLLSMGSMVLVGAGIFAVIYRSSASKAAGGIGAMLWITLMVHRAENHVGFDPQMMGHLTGVGALYLYLKWSESLTAQRILLVALLCTISLFIKHNLVALPAALAVVLFFKDRRSFYLFALGGITFSAILLLSTWAVWGNAFFANFMELDRSMSLTRLDERFRKYIGMILLFPLFLIFLRQKGKELLIAYGVFSFLIGLVALSGAGVDVNCWFDLYVAAAISLGWIAAAYLRMPNRLGTVAAALLLFSCLLPFLPHLQKNFAFAFNPHLLVEREEAFQRDAGFLKSIDGPVLFEDPLLGYHAGKPFLFDPFLGSQMIVSGRLSHRLLDDAIQNHCFAAIALYLDFPPAAARVDSGSPISPLRPTTRFTELWTDHTLKTIYENYRPVRFDRQHLYYFYVPKGEVGDSKGCFEGK